MRVFIVGLFILFFALPSLPKDEYAREKQAFELAFAADTLHPDSIDQLLNDYTRITLPPLNIFLESVYKHSSVGIYEALYDEQKAELKSIQREWLDYISIVGNYQFGHVMATTSQTASDLPLYLTSNGAIQNSFNIGLHMSVPLGGLFGVQKNKTRVEKAQLRRIEYEYEMALEERKLMILQAYNRVVQELTVLKAKSDAAALYNAQMRISEQAFINGQIDIITLSLERSRRTGAIVTYQEGKATLQDAISRLEMLTNIRILNR